jgi:hypothetical protein
LYCKVSSQTVQNTQDPSFLLLLAVAACQCSGWFMLPRQAKGLLVVYPLEPCLSIEERQKMATPYQDLPVPVKRRHAGNQPVPNTEDVFTPQHHRDYKPFIVAGMVLFLALFILLQSVVLPWWQGVSDQWQYGSSRISTIEVFIGHQDSPTHPTTILSFDLHGRVDIIEFPGGDSAKARNYPGADIYGENKDRRVVTIEPVDVNHDRRLDLLIHIEGMSTTPVLYNNGSSFQWTETHS